MGPSFPRKREPGAAGPCAVWIVPRLADASKLTHALHNPSEGPPRIDRTYSATTQTADYTIDEPGFTAIYTASTLKERLNH